MSADQDHLRQGELAAAAMAATSLPLLTIGPAGTIGMASAGAAALFGKPLGELEGTPLGGWFVPAAAAEDCRPTAGCHAHELRQLQIRNAAGEIIPVEVSCSLFAAAPEPAGGQGPGEPVSHCMLVFEDMRQRDQREDTRAARLAKLSLLNQVSEALYSAHLSLDQILQAILICMTAGEGLRFNRAFLLLNDEKTKALKGEIAIGPSNADEAARIWETLAGKPGDLLEMMTSYDRSIKQTDVAVNEIVRHMSVPLDDQDNILIRAMKGVHALGVRRDSAYAGVETVRHWLGCDRFAIAPLITRSGALGVIVADNAISGMEITELDLEFLQLFANQSAGAIENSRLNQELAGKVEDLRRAQERQREDQATLLRMERLSVMGETSAIVAHELRNPLVAIGGFARTLMRNLPADDDNRKYAEIISGEVGRMETIIHDLLDFIRPQKVLRRSVELDVLVADTAERYRDEMEARGVALAVDLQAEGVFLDCHPGEIQQVLQNYLINAMQAQPDGGRVLVRSHRLAGGLRVEVLDDGNGFKESDTEKMFAPFFSTKTTGSGLGLTICAQIIKAHGGVAGAQNRQEGGALFFFILPLPKDIPEK
jgi:signal transduction histidine kinase